MGQNKPPLSHKYQLFYPTYRKMTKTDTQIGQRSQQVGGSQSGKGAGKQPQSTRNGRTLDYAPSCFEAEAFATLHAGQESTVGSWEPKVWKAESSFRDGDSVHRQECAALIKSHHSLLPSLSCSCMVHSSAALPKSTLQPTQQLLHPLEGCQSDLRCGTVLGCFKTYSQSRG